MLLALCRPGISKIISGSVPKSTSFTEVSKCFGDLSYPEMKETELDNFELVAMKIPFRLLDLTYFVKTIEIK